MSHSFVGALTAFIITVARCCVLVAEEFRFEGKVALVTGAGQGIGFACSCELLRNGVKGVTVVDIDPVQGERAVMKIIEVFGAGRAILIVADVSNINQLEDAFQASIDYWKRLDIVVNNAGVYNENKWRTIVNVNVVGVLQGTLLGFKYMSKNKGGRGGVILNMSSTTGITPHSYLPVYSATKSFVVGLGRSLGHPVYYEYNHVRIVTLCPGFTKTEMTDLTKFRDSISNVLSPIVKQFAVENLKNSMSQSISHVANSCTQVIKKGSNGSVWVVEGDLPPYEVVFPHRRLMRKKKRRNVRRKASY